jgi:hypothetical protein
MIGFKEFINEAKQEILTSEEHPRLYDFLHHLSSPTIGGGSLKEAHDIEPIMSAGIENKPSGNLFAHLREGFHAAFPEGETPEVTHQKALEARKHFRNFMTTRGGMASDNELQLTGENGKTALSTGAGMQTLGLALAPHHSSGYKQDLCPKATAECRKNCLGFTAGGNRQFPVNSFRAKLLRTHYLGEHPEYAARLIDHEISENEKWSNENHFVTDQTGNVVGTKHKITGKVTSSTPIIAKGAAGKEERANNVKAITEGLAKGTHNTKEVNSGFRGNVTSDLPYEHLMPKKFFEKHGKTQFYDYTKIASRVGSKNLPSNYSLALSHTGTGHDESNDKDVIKHLEAGHVIAMVHQNSKITPTHVEDVQTGKRYPLVNGDADDNVYDRHKSAGIPKSKGVVSGLKLKGVSKEAAGSFANPVDADGIIRINK